MQVKWSRIVVFSSTVTRTQQHHAGKLPVPVEKWQHRGWMNVAPPVRHCWKWKRPDAGPAQARGAIVATRPINRSRDRCFSSNNFPQHEKKIRSRLIRSPCDCSPEVAYDQWSHWCARSSRPVGRDQPSVPLLGNDADQRFTGGKAGDATTSTDRGKSEGDFALFHTPPPSHFPRLSTRRKICGGGRHFFLCDSARTSRRAINLSMRSSCQ